MSRQLKKIGESFQTFQFQGKVNNRIKNEIVLAFKTRKSNLRQIAIEALSKTLERVVIVYKATFQSQRKMNYLLPPSRIKNITNFIKDDIYNR